VSGLILASIGIAVLTRLGPHSGYFAHVLPSLVLIGLGFGAIVPPAFNSATQGVEFKDAGVASAMVNTMQQVGGSIGAAMLSAFAAQATSRYLADHVNVAHPAALAAAAATHGYTVAFAISAGIFLGAAVICGAMIRRHPPADAPAVSGAPGFQALALDAD
jgi:hypothetical protein